MMLALESDEVKVGGPIPDEKVKLMVDFIGGGSSTPFRLYMHGWRAVYSNAHLNMHCKLKGVVLSLSSNFRESRFYSTEELF